MKEAVNILILEYRLYILRSVKAFYMEKKFLPFYLNQCYGIQKR